MATKPTRQFAFRLPHDLVRRIEECERQIDETGLRLSRTDVVRLLLTYALNKSDGELAELVRSQETDAKTGRPSPRRATKRKR